MAKTMAMLSTIEAGTWLPDDVPCYDKTELVDLAVTLNRLIYSPSSLRKALQDRGVTVTRADFYSEVPTVAEIEASFATPSKLKLDKVFPDPEFMKACLAELEAFAGEFTAPVTAPDASTYSWEGVAFGFSDAPAYYSMIRLKKPKTIIEIGSGASTLVARMAVAKNGFGRIIAVEPYPLDYLPGLSDIDLVRKRAQDLDSAFFNDRMEDGDMLFIDSTHTVKHDSDVLHIYLRILPEIRKSITVHAHDIYLPGTLPVNMLREHQAYWNEQYLLYAYMLENPRVRTLFSSRYHMQYNHAALTAFMHEQYAPGGASFWFEQSGLVR